MRTPRKARSEERGAQYPKARSAVLTWAVVQYIAQHLTMTLAHHMPMTLAQHLPMTPARAFARSQHKVDLKEEAQRNGSLPVAFDAAETRRFLDPLVRDDEVRRLFVSGHMRIVCVAGGALQPHSTFSPLVFTWRMPPSTSSPLFTSRAMG